MRQTTGPTDGQWRTSGEAERFRRSPFYSAFSRAILRRGMQPSLVCDLRAPGARRLLAEYGAMFVAGESVSVPPACVFGDETEVARFQQQAGSRSTEIDGAKIELQPAALDALLRARADALDAGLDITPRGGEEAARRGHADTLRLWHSRVRPALEYWSAEGRLDAAEAAQLASLEPAAQLEAVLALEAGGIFFSKDFAKSILYSVAAPGASQHLALLAFDIVEFREPRVRDILTRHGWFQTVRSDLPHFTFLDREESELPGLGLRRVEEHGQTFWVPDVG